METVVGAMCCASVSGFSNASQAANTFWSSSSIWCIDSTDVAAEAGTNADDIRHLPLLSSSMPGAGSHRIGEQSASSPSDRRTVHQNRDNSEVCGDEHREVGSLRCRLE